MPVFWSRASVWTKHLDDNFVACFKVKVTDCQAVVGSFSLIKEEQLVRPHVDESALVINPTKTLRGSIGFKSFIFVIKDCWFVCTDVQSIRQLHTNQSMRTRFSGSSVSNPVAQDARRRRRRLPVHPDPAVLVVAHRSEFWIPWTRNR